ncbi:hypothetical protein GCM10023216_00210 [Isoptericola chiayiensis]|uniref:DUF5979 domain-containing protein n=1 Tax=Isoptericola chiayiensis TaxID=579446 RepID=A0ABP8XVT1_9MICO|nr:hypothetical protein [Isoptericola chiayiensis]
MFALTLPLVAVPATTASAASWQVGKAELTSGPYQPGETVTWVVTISCSDPNADPCVPTTLTDPLPEYVDLVSASIQNEAGATGGSLVADEDSDTVTYSADSVNNGGQVQILVTAQITDDIPYAMSGETITNTATVVSDNAPEQSASDDIVPEVPLSLDSMTTKSIDPDGAIAAPGTPATVTLGSTNASNDPVDSLVITEPTAGTDPNPFTYLGFTGWGAVSWPDGATGAEVTFTCAGGTTENASTTDVDTLPDPPAGCEVEGFTIEFTGTIEIGASASIPFDVEQTDAVTTLEDATTVTDETASYVTHGDDQSDPEPASDTYVITPPNNSVAPSKSFDPDVVSAGDPTTVTLGAVNEGDPTTSLSITEPSPGTDSPFEGDAPLTFTGWGADTDGDGIGDGAVQWPANADAASVTYTCADASTPTVDATAVGTLPEPPAGCDVVGFTVEFTGDIVTGAEASLPFTADTDPDQETDDVVHSNEITATIPNDSETASDDLTTLTDRLATETTKSISPSTIPALPGQTVVVGLPTQLLPFGPDGSTTNADQIVVQDPTDTGDPGEFWDNFSASSVRSTDVPAGTELTINYWNGSEWVEAPDCGSPVQGAATVNCALPDDAQGVQFVYDDTTGNGIPPGTSVSPNFVASYDGPQDRDDPIANCGASSAESGTVAPTDPAEACTSVDPFPVPTNPGELDFIDKQFLAPEGQDGTPYSVRARTQDEITAQITWSTNGFEGVDPMVISDIADPIAADDPAIEGSFYDAFDLVKITVDDPLLQYDQVESVELFIDGAWVEASGDPCPCDGSFPGYTLTDAESAAATSARLTYTESPTRAEFPADPTIPAAGEGVARSTQGDGRHVDLTFRLRDDRRSGGPALGREQGEIYNTADPGLVNDTARGTATFQGTERTDVDDDDVLILDQPINVGITKNWAAGPLSVPPEGTPYDDFPTTVVTVTASNNSVARVDELRIAEPSTANAANVVEPETGEGTNPFDAFTLTDIIAIDPPDGTEDTVVALTRWDGAAWTTVEYTEGEAEGLVAADLTDVVGVEVTFDGRIASSELGDNEGVLEMRLKLRELDRYTGNRVEVDHDPNPVPNSAGAEVSDPGGTTAQTPQAWNTDDMELLDAEISMVQTKSFTPASVVEPGSDAEDNPTSVLEITGQPTGPSRAVEMLLTDVDGSFWNQYDLVDLADTTFRAPIDQVQIDACTGGAYDAASDTFADCTWTEGTPSDAFALPAGVDPADVVGLRFSFTKADGTIWENPSNPTQVVHLTVQVRDTLRSDPGTLVPTDLEANDPAPGEEAPGVATNDVAATVTGADLVFNPDDPQNPIPVSSEADATGTITYEHAENGVQVVKDFDTDISGGTKPPGAPFSMNITVTNVGNRPIVDPVITDPMPTQADGPDLRLADVAEPYSYALTEPAEPPPGQPNGPQMPTDPSEVTVDRSGNITNLEWTFPEGTVLEVGQTYTITVQVIFRTTLEANTLVENTAGVTGDRPWDVCQTLSGQDGSVVDGRLDEQTGACEADADVTPIPSGVLAESKLVRATSNEYPLGLIVDPDQPGSVTPEECSPNAAGFYAYPCTPVVPPGENETWRIRVDNVGNLPMDKVVIYDRLPTPGDTASDPTSSSERGSQWSPVLTNDPPPTVVNAPAGSTTTFYYTTTDDYCPADLTDPLNEPTCSDDPAAGGWAELTADTTDEVYEEIVALKAVIEMADGNLFRPGAFLALEGTSTTPPEAPEAGDEAIAFNSAATSGVVVTPSGSRISSLSTEGTKVGVATATGPLEVNKLVAGPAADLAPDSFEMTVTCTAAVGSWLETELDPISITVTPGTPTLVEDLPFGSECTLTEDASGGQSELVVDTVTIASQDPDDPTTILATNYYNVSTIELSKEVVTDAVDQDGEPIGFGPFEVEVECTFLGETVLADGYTESPMVVEIVDGETVELTDLPVNSECTVTETGTGNASSTTVTVRHGLQQPEVFEGTVGNLDLVGDLVSIPRNAVTVTNVYDVGALHLIKDVTGSGADDFGDGPFVFDVTCTYDDDGDGGADPRTVWADTVSLGGGDPLEVTIENIPTGAVCEVVETDDGGATDSSLDPVDGTVTIGDQQGVEVTATNEFDLGTVQVDKELAGLGALYGPGPFEVSIECTYQGDPLEIPGGAVRTLNPGDPVLYEGLPVGSECTVTETGTFGATSTSMSVDGGDAVDGTSVDVVVPPATDGEPTAVEVLATNTFTTAPLAITKVVDGDGAAFAPAMPDLPERPAVPDPPYTPEVVEAFLDELEAYLAEVPFEEFPYQASLACTFDEDGDPGTPALDVPIPGGETRRFGPGFPALYFGLPLGAECTVTETDIGGATDVAIEPVPVEIVETQGPLTPIEATVANTYDVGRFTVEKVVDGDGAELWGAGPFEVSAACTFLGEEIDVPGGATRPVAPGEPAVFDDLPVGAVCTVSESDDGSATDVTISSAVEDGTPGQVVVPEAGDTSVGLTVTNTFDLGEVVVEKAVDGDGGEAWGAGPFDVELACTFNGSEIEIPGGAVQTVERGGSVTYTDLPVGAECSVTEPDDGSATATSISPDSVTVGHLDEDPVTFTVTNTFDLGSVEVDKELAGLGALYGPGPFEVTLECTFNGEQIEIPGGAVRVLVPDETVVYAGLPVGAECTVTETDTFGASSVEVAVDGGDPVEFGDGETPSADVVVPGNDGDGPTSVQVSVTNVFDTAPLVIRKTVDGDAAQFAPAMPELPGLPELPAGPIGVDELEEFLAEVEEFLAQVPFEEFPYQVSLACTYDTGTSVVDVPIPGGATRAFGPGFPGLYFGLPDGAECTVTEPEAGGATSVAFDPETVVVDGQASVLEPIEAVVTNTYDAGTIQVDKVVDGAAGQFGVGPFEVSLACTFEGQDIEIPGGAVRSLTPGEPVLYEGLPVDAECVVTETDAAGATSSSVSTAVDGGEPGQAVVSAADADPALVTVTNTFDAGAIIVDKEVVFTGASSDVGPFEVTLVCTFQGERIEIPGGAVRELSPGDPVTYDGLPAGADCVVTESDDGGAVSSEVSSVDGGEPGAVTIAAGGLASVTVTNTFDAPPPGPLPRTGADVVAWIGVALLLLLSGAALLAVRRRTA